MRSDDDIATTTSSPSRVASVDDLLLSDLFEHVDAAILHEAVSRAEILDFRRGDVLVREGGASDALYVIVDGRVEVVLERPGTDDHLVDILGRGDCVGDMALLLDQVRSATVRALRDSRVLRLPAADFHWLLQISPAFAQRLARTLGARLQRTTHRLAAGPPIETVALVALPGIDHAMFGPALAQAISHAIGADCAYQDAASNGIRNAQVHRVVACDAALGETALATLRSADLVLIAVDAVDVGKAFLIDAVRDAVADTVPRPRLELALLRPADTKPSATRTWLRGQTFASWHHVRRDSLEDLARLARRIAGTATGVVLSGGGARGFAHIGILRAFDELSMPIDFVAGTSMGAIIGAQYAAGYSHTEMMAIARDSYLRRSRPSEFSLPYVAIHNGSGTNRRLQRMFGERRIENMAIPFFCVSSNLSAAEPVIHDIGKLWLATRCSCSVPGLLPPVRHRGAYLVDGGLLDNLPVGAMRARCRGRIVASDVSVAIDFTDSGERPPDWRRRQRFPALLGPSRMPGIGAILTRTVSLASVRDARNAGTPADLYLHPAVDDIGMSDFGRLDEIVERGASYARVQLLANGLAR